MKSDQKLITALYCRLSIEDLKLGDSVSIENQKMMLQKYADDNGFLNCKFYVDDGYSGSDLTRPAYRQMLADVEAGLVGTVIVKDQSRLGRDHLETDRLMELYFPSYDVRFIAVTDNVDSINGISEMSTLRNYFNEFYARDTSKKIRAVLHAKAENGERISSMIPYGYKKDDDNPKKIVPDPEAAEVVRRIFEMSADGTSMKHICKVFTEEQIYNPGAYHFVKYGSRAKRPNMNDPYFWSVSTVRSILSNRIYCGDTVNFKTYSKSHKLKKRIPNAPENMVIIENTHEPIVSRKLFELVQKHFPGRKRPDTYGKIDKYAGYVYCADCGSRLYLHRDLKRPQNNAYECGVYQRKGSHYCTAHLIRASVLERIVLENLRQVTAYARENPEEFYALAAQNGEAEAKRIRKETEQRCAEITTRIAQLDNIIRCLYEDRVVGRITPERYDSMAIGYEQEQAELKEKLAVMNQQRNELDLRNKCVQEFMDRAKEYLEMPELTPELMRMFIRRIEVREKLEKYKHNNGKTVIIHYTFDMSSDKKS